MNLLRVIVAVPRDPDLSWLLNESSAATGIRSSFGVLADAATGGWGGGRQDPHEGRTRGYVDKAGHFRQPWLEAVARSRALRTRWDSLAAPEHGVAVQTVLFHAYTEKRCPPETERPLGGLASVAPATSAFRAAYEPTDGAPMDWLADVCRRGHHKSLVEEIRKQSLWLIDESLERWRATGPKRGVQGPDGVEGAATRFRRFLEALAAVDGPRDRGAPRTWAAVAPGWWESPRESGRANARRTWSGEMHEHAVGECWEGGAREVALAAVARFGAATAPDEMVMASRAMRSALATARLCPGYVGQEGAA